MILCKMLLVTSFLAVSYLWRSYADDSLLTDSVSDRSSADIFTDDDSEPNLYLDNPMEQGLSPGLDRSSTSYADSSAYGSDGDLFSDPSLSSSDIALTVDPELIANIHCPTLNGKSRKRDGATCPAPATNSLTLPTLPFTNNEPEPPDEEAQQEQQQQQQQQPGQSEKEKKLWEEFYDDMDFGPLPPKFDDRMEKCQGVLIFDRVIEVCCDGPFGPFVIDKRVRLIYKYIDLCNIGTSRATDFWGGGGSTIFSFSGNFAENNNPQQLPTRPVPFKSTPAVDF